MSVQHTMSPSTMLKNSIECSVKPEFNRPSVTVGTQTSPSLNSSAVLSHSSNNSVNEHHGLPESRLDSTHMSSKHSGIKSDSESTEENECHKYLPYHLWCTSCWREQFCITVCFGETQSFNNMYSHLQKADSLLPGSSFDYSYRLSDLNQLPDFEGEEYLKRVHNFKLLAPCHHHEMWR